MTRFPEIDVILPTKGEHDYLEMALRSLKAQTYTRFNVLLLDNSETKEAQNYIRRMAQLDSRFIQISTHGAFTGEKNLSKILNFGLRLSSSCLIARQDDDDLSLPHRFETQVKILESGVDMCGSQGIYINENYSFKYATWLPTHPSKIESYMRLANPFLHTSVMFKRQVIDEIGIYDEDLVHGQDLDLWNRLSLEKFQITNSRKVMVMVRFRENSITTNSKFNGARLTNEQIVARKRNCFEDDSVGSYWSLIINLPTVLKNPRQVGHQVLKSPFIATLALTHLIYVNIKGLIVLIKTRKNYGIKVK